MKKLFSRFFSMKFALILLAVLAVSCSVGSVIPQGESLTYYTENYSTSAAGAIMLFGLDDIFHCWWLVLLTLILCANLLGCNLIHFPALIHRARDGFSFQKAIANWNGSVALWVTDPQAVFSRCGFRKSEEARTEDGKRCLYAVKNRIGIWGAWLCHLGMLIVIIGFGLGQLMKEEYTVYGVPGETLAVEGTDYEVTIDDFEVALREDDTVDQYTSQLTVTNTQTGSKEQGIASVNHPFSCFGMQFYQNSTGWAAEVQIWKDNKMIQSHVLCAGEYFYMQAIPDLAIMFSAFYPDYAEAEDGSPMTQSSRLNNPAYLYRLYYQDEILGMNLLTNNEAITLEEDYTILFTNPQNYTLIQIKRDPFTKLTAAGALILLAGLILAFYLRTAEVWAIEQEEGVWILAGKSRKGGEEFQEGLVLAAQSFAVDSGKARESGQIRRESAAAIENTGEKGE